MRQMVKASLAILTVLLFTNNAFAQITTSGSRLIHVQEARLPKGGTLTMYNNMSAYGGSAGGTVGAYWDIRNALSVDYSIDDFWLISLNATLYQDLNDGSGGANTPLNDISLTVKSGSYGFAADHFFMGGLINFGLPIGDDFTHNIGFEIYRGMGFNFHLQGLLSYYSDNLFPEESFGGHLNFGFSFYADKDKLLINPKNYNNIEVKAPSSISELKYGLGGKYPFSFIDIYGEIWGNIFLKEPDDNVQAKETYSYLTLGLTAKPFDFIHLDFSADVLMVGSKNKSNMTPLPGVDVNYAPWKLNMGLKANILPFKTSYTIDPSRRYEVSDQEAQEIRNRVRIIEENEKVTRDKVEVLKTKRKDVENNLKQLRNLLKDLDTSGN